MIPVGPGETAYRDLLGDLQTIDANAEIILVATETPPDDWTRLTAAASCRLRWVEATAGRAAQMNRGVEAALGDYFWFLHADSRVDEAALKAFNATVGHAPDVLYYFDLGFNSDGPALCRLNARGANLRSRWLGLPFGDQGFCVSRVTYQRLGPYDVDVANGEDHLWVWTARRRGIALHRVPSSIRTSSRKYASNGWFRTTMLHAWRTFQQAAGELRKNMKGRR